MTRPESSLAGRDYVKISELRQTLDVAAKQAWAYERVERIVDCSSLALAPDFLVLSHQVAAGPEY